MKNRDNDKNEYVHLYIALRRRKDNKDGQELCFRQIIMDDEVDFDNIVNRIKKVSGVWRIHKTINKRSTKIATKQLQKKLIDEPELHSSLISVYKTLLMKPDAKAERNILIDIDVDDIEYVNKILSAIGSRESVIYKTPNGYHVVSPLFDTRLLDGYEVTIQRDGYRFVTSYEVIDE